jgi:hypothetical protein
MTEFDDFNVPMCRFGPGGDYVNSWPAKKFQLPGQGHNPLGKVLAMIADVMGTTVSGELMIQAGTTGRHKADFEAPSDNYVMPEKISSAAKRTQNTSYTPSIAGIRDSSPIAAEPVLFADDCRSSRGAGRKPHYRIRAYRRSGRKRTAHKIEPQATLFEVDTASQSAA